MKIRSVTFLALALLIVSALVGWSLLATPVSGSAPLRQDATSQQQTIDAEVQRLLQATQQAEQNLAITQTIQAAFNGAQTATAAYEGTVQDLLNQALTATAVFELTVEAQLQQYVQATAIARQGLEPISSQNAGQLQPLALILMSSGMSLTSLGSPDGTWIVLTIGGRSQVIMVNTRDFITGQFAPYPTLTDLLDSDSDSDLPAVDTALLQRFGDLPVWIPDANNLSMVVLGGNGILSDHVYSPDSSMVVYPDFSANAFRILSTATGQTIAQLPFPTEHSYSWETTSITIAFRADSKVLATWIFSPGITEQPIAKLVGRDHMAGNRHCRTPGARRKTRSWTAYDKFWFDARWYPGQLDHGDAH